MSTRLQTHNDLPSLEDKLGRIGIIDQIARDIADGRPPFVFAVHGDWGAGKTSFLRQLEVELCGRSTMGPQPDEANRRHKNIEHVFPVWFEAWRYQHEPAPVVALIHEIYRQLPMHKKLWEGIKKWTSISVKGVLGAFKEATAELEAEVEVTGVGKLTKKVGATVENPLHSIRREAERWDTENLAGVLSTDRIRGLISDGISELLGKDPNHRVCVIIDDLDRCQPEAVWRLLEGIKIHLCLPQCVFVLGVNLQQLRHAISTHMPGYEGRVATDDPAKETEHRARCEAAAAEYLEKLCTFSWKLPLPVPDQQVEVLNLWLCDPPESAGKKTTPLPVSLRAELCRLAKEHRCLPANPRKIKGLANAIRSLAGQAWATTDGVLQIPDDEAPSLLASACLYHFHPDIVRYLQSDEAMYQRLRDWVVAFHGSDDDRNQLYQEAIDSGAIYEDTPSKALVSHPCFDLLQIARRGLSDPVDLRVFRVADLLHVHTKTNAISAARLSRYLGTPL